MALPISAIEAIKAAGASGGIGPMSPGMPGMGGMSQLFGDTDASFADGPAGAVGTPDLPSYAAPTAAASSPASFGGIMQSIGQTGAQLNKAQSAEAAFANHVPGVGIQDVIIERAKADVLLKVASAAASKASQAASTLLNMQM